MEHICVRYVVSVRMLTRINLLYILMSSLSWVSIIYTHIHLCRCGSATYAQRGICPATSFSLTSRPVVTPCTASKRRVLSTAAKARADDAGEEWAIVISRRRAEAAISRQRLSVASRKHIGVSRQKEHKRAHAHTRNTHCYYM